jgi:hypothetical protein
MSSAIAAKSIRSIIKYSAKIIISLHYFFFNSRDFIFNDPVVAFPLQLSQDSLSLGFVSLLENTYYIVEYSLVILWIHL